MSSKRTLLIEIGTEELPPKALMALATAFSRSVCQGLTDANLEFDDHKTYATPRRMAVKISALAAQQGDETIQRRGPNVKAAFDDAGEPTKAAVGFAKSCGVAFESLGRLETDKGEFLSFESVKQGSETTQLLQGVVASALDTLPIPKRMRWGAGSGEFVRPVHWILALFGEEIVPLEFFGLTSGNTTRGHRFHGPDPFSLDHPDNYEQSLLKAFVIPDFAQRRTSIADQVAKVAQALDGVVVADEALLDEVTALVEWPVAVSGSFDSRFLTLPKEVLISTLKDHQRYFPVETAGGELKPFFITISNIESKEPSLVSAGNERVVRPRLEDAEFFFHKDRQVTLTSRIPSLDKVTFQNQLGSLGDKVRRVANLTAHMAGLLGQDEDLAQKAASLCKCDLVTDMVGEFPELQGVMGRYYGQLDGEPDEVVIVLDEHYRPRFAGDDLPSTLLGQMLSIADKLDTIAGIFAIGQPPSGTKDPFGLRRNALGILRILIESEIDLDLKGLVTFAVQNQPVAEKEDNSVVQQVFTYLMERLRGYYLDQDQFTSEMFTSVAATEPTRPLDFNKRVLGVLDFMPMDEAPSLIAANKRIANILKKEASDSAMAINPDLFSEKAEVALSQALEGLREQLESSTAAGQYKEALVQLASLREPVDNFFDQVMVMHEDQSIKNNRVALLTDVRKLFLRIADVQHLQGA